MAFKKINNDIPSSIVQTLIYLGIAIAAILVFRVSITEPFDLITKRDLIWQLVIPSGGVSLTIRELLDLFSTRKKISKTEICSKLGVIAISLIIFLEAIYGYFWDLTVYLKIM
jgi:hypothetical protein